MINRRLPVYLLLDCSESMIGPAIDAVGQGVAQLVTELKGNPLALETVHLSVITFSRYARQDVQLTELMKFQPPKLSVRPGTALGAALQLLVQCIDREVVKTTSAIKGDYRPLVFLLTDGQPTDEWEIAASRIRCLQSPRIANVYAIGCGPDVDTDVLRRITDIVFVMPDLTPDKIHKFFVWLSASIQTVSSRVEGGLSDDMIDPGVLLPGVLEKSHRSTSPRESTPRQVFLHARCIRTRRPYLMRYALRSSDRHYEPVAGHPLESFDESDGHLLPPINSSLLDGAPGCPYCGNRGAGMCGCGTVFCLGQGFEGPVVCPKCEAQLTRSQSGSFDISPAEG